MQARTLLLALMLAAFTPPGATAADNDAAGRQAALAALGSPDAARRLEGIAGLARLGGSADAKPLINLLRDPDDTVRSAAERGIWELWGHSGDERIDRLYREGVAHMAAARYSEAMPLFTRIIRERPAFAEGWNKRATLYFMLGDLQRSLRDCAEVVKRNPEHFGVLSGMGQIYLAREDYERALEYFRRALEVNPNLAGVARGIEQIEAIQGARRRNMI